ncbi:MAG TPA: NADH-quinone oxidoreductase subunit NuoG [Acidimicrobiales bacterium]
MTDIRARSSEAAEEMISITVDGTPIKAHPGELIIAAAEREGVFVPRFCYHPRMEPVGMCRMCLVEVSGPRGFSLQPACFLKVADGLEVLTNSDKARKAQEGVLEFLLVNHPLDCPVCDKGGECPLQDQALSHGPGESRFVEEKRHWAKPIEIGHFVELDRERCIQCARCTRFADEIAGDAEIDMSARGDLIEISPFPTKPFNSYFSGNTIQICPVGALTAAPYRFKARPWDLEQVESTCTTCSVGCRHVAQSSAGKLVRFLGIDSDPVNQSWLCDKGRFSFETLYGEHRVTQPMLRKGDALVEVRWHEALAAATTALRDAQAADAASIAVVGGARFSNEDAYAWAKLAKSVLGTDSVDAQLGDGLPAETVLGLPRATIDEACSARVVILLGPDLREELPVLFLRLRAAALANATKLVEISPVETSLSSLAEVRLSYVPGESRLLAEGLVGDSEQAEAEGDALEDLRRARALIGDGSDVVVVLGRPSLAESGETIASSAAALHAGLPGARFLSALRRANVHGALDMGLAPGVAPGRVALASASEELTREWGELPLSAGRDATHILQSAAAGDIAVLVLLGADPLSDFPDRSLAKAALERVPFVLSLATNLDASSSGATVVLPVTADGERSGTTTNLEGRVSRLAAKVATPGVVWAPWIVATEIGARLGAPLGAATLESLTDEISRVAPAYAGVDAALLGDADRRDGVVVPFDKSLVASLPRPIDPIATPGITSVFEQGAPIRVGTGEPVGGQSQEFEVPNATPATALVMSSAVVVAPRLDAYSQRLVLGRSLYDEGTLVETSPSMQGLASSPTLRVHPSELAKLGVTSGDKVRVRSASGSVEIATTADESIDRHVVASRFTQDVAGECDLAALIEASLLATDVRLETI